MVQTRRRFLEVAALSTAGGLTGLAGCTGSGGDGGGAGTDTPTAGGMATTEAGGTTTTEGGPTSATATESGADGEPTVTVSTHSTLGDILTDGAGNTLYLFTPDSPGESVCTGSCAEAWPPLTVEAAADLAAGEGVEASLGTIERDDGSLQVTAGDVPLYYFVRDEASGEATGQEVNNVWFVLRPDASPVKPTVSVREHPDLGPILTDADGMTLYLFTNDEGTTSTCTGGCADTWPPLTVEADDSLVESVRADVELGTTEHPEAGPMATAASHPLYYYAPDEEPGDATGQGVGGVWFVLDEEGNAVET